MYLWKNLFPFNVYQHDGLYRTGLRREQNGFIVRRLRIHDICLVFFIHLKHTRRHGDTGCRANACVAVNEDFRNLRHVRSIMPQKIFLCKTG